MKLRRNSADGLSPHFIMCYRFLPTTASILLSVTHSFRGRCAASGTFASASMLAHGGLVTLSHRWHQVSRGLKWFIDNLLAKEVKGRRNLSRCLVGCCRQSIFWWRRWFSSAVALSARNHTASRHLKSAGIMPASTGRYSAFVGRRKPWMILQLHLLLCLLCWSCGCCTIRGQQILQR